MTVSYRYIGKGTTDANGVAHITEDAEGNDISSNPGYTGVGAGEIDVVASVDKPITTGSIQSNTYEIIDGILSDINGVGNIDYRNPVGANIDRTGGNTVFTAHTVGTMVYCQLSLNHTQNYNFNDTGEFVVEFDVLEYSGNSKVEITANNGSATHWLASRSFTETGHYAYYMKETSQYLIDPNGTRVPLNNKTLSDYTASIYVAFDTDNKLKVNNVVAYPI